MLFLTIAAVLANSSRHALAAEEAPVLGEIEVTAEPIDEAEQRAPTAFISVIEVPDRVEPIETTADVLSQSVGVQVQRFGGLGAFSTISIRGSTANQVPFYLDGVPLSQAQDQTVNLSDLPLDSLDRIEVYRGTVPVGFGGGGIGGVVNLVTRPAEEEPRSEVSVGYGSFETRKVVGTYTRRIGDTELLAHASYLGSKGDFTYFDDNGTPENPSDDGETTRINNAFNSVDGLAKVTQDLGDGLAADVVQEIFYKQQGVPGPGSVQFAEPSLEGLRSLTYLRLRKDGLFEGAVDADVTLYGVYNLQKFSDPEGDFGARQDTRNQTMLIGSNTDGTWLAPFGQAIGWFGEIAGEEFFPYNEFAAPLPQNGPNQSRLRLTLAAQNEIAFLDERLIIVPSLRYDHLRDDFSGVNLANAPDTPAETSDLDLWTPAIGAEARVVPWFSLRANLGRFQRAPNFAELFGNSGSVLGNAELQPETGLNRDVGFIATWPRWQWLDAGHLQYAFFYNDVHDLIAFEQANPRQFRPFNIGDARIDGSEVSLGAGVLEHAGLELNYTHQNSEDLGIDSPEGNQLPLRPADELFVQPRLFADKGAIYYQYTYLSANPTDADNFEIVPSRSIHTIGLSVQTLPWLSLRFEAVNLGNADVRDLGDFPLPGLSFFGGAQAIF